MSHYVVPYRRELMGFRRSFMGNMGADLTFSGCVQAYDANGNSVSCSDSSATIWMDSQGNTVPAGTPTGSGGATASPSTPGPGGAPTGSILVYQGTWQAFPTLNPNGILSRVSSALRSYGLQVVNSQSDAGVLTIGNFNVQLTLQVINAGYGQPSDAGSLVDHAYYTVTGHMPVTSGTFLQSAPGVPSNLPPGSQNAPPQPPQNFTQWFEQNAWWIGALVVGAVVLPKVL